MDFLLAYWPLITGISGALAAIAVFIRTILSIQKLNLEIQKLQWEEKAAKMTDKKIDIVRIQSMEDAVKIMSEDTGIKIQQSSFTRRRMNTEKPAPRMHMIKAESIDTIRKRFKQLTPSILMIGLIFISYTDLGQMVFFQLIFGIAIFGYAAYVMTFLLKKYISHAFELILLKLDPLKRGS